VNGTAVAGDAVAARTLSNPEAASDVIQLGGVHFRWPGRDGFSLGVEAFRVAAGEKLLLIGPSGSGKSTLLSLLCGIVTPDAGEIRVLGTDLSTLDAASITASSFRCSTCSPISP